MDGKGTVRVNNGTSQRLSKPGEWNGTRQRGSHTMSNEEGLDLVLYDAGFTDQTFISLHCNGITDSLNLPITRDQPMLIDVQTLLPISGFLRPQLTHWPLPKAQ